MKLQIISAALVAIASSHALAMNCNQGHFRFGTANPPNIEVEGIVEGSGKLPNFEGPDFEPQKCVVRFEAELSGPGTYRQSISTYFTATTKNESGQDELTGQFETLVEFEVKPTELLPVFNVGQANQSLQTLQILGREGNDSLTLENGVLNYGSKWIGKSYTSRCMNFGPLGRHAARLITQRDWSTHTWSGNVLDVTVKRRLNGDFTGLSTKVRGSARCRIEQPAIGSVEVPRED